MDAKKLAKALRNATHELDWQEGLLFVAEALELEHEANPKPDLDAVRGALRRIKIQSGYMLNHEHRVSDGLAQLMHAQRREIDDTLAILNATSKEEPANG